MRHLLQVTGKEKTTPNLDNFQQQNVLNLQNSAFNTVPNKGGLPDIQQLQQPPQAFQSTATHFTPIVVSSTNKPPAIGAKESRTKSGANSPSEKDKQVAKKLRELRRNLMKNRAPLNLAEDIEKEATQEESHISTTEQPSNMASIQGDNVSPNQNQGMQNMQTMPNIQAMQQGNMTNIGQMPLMNGIPGQGQMPVFQGHTQMQPGQFQGQGQMPQRQFQGQGQMPQGQFQGQGQIPQGQYQGQGQIPQGQFQGPNMPMQPFGFPMSGVQQQAGGMPLPFHVQLQQDPRTGMFNIIPLPINMNMQQNGQNMFPNQQQSQMFINGANSTSQQQPQPSGEGESEEVNPYVTYQDLLNVIKIKDKVDSDGDKSDSKSERKRYAKHHSKDKVKEQKLRTRSDNSAAEKENLKETVAKKSSSSTNMKNGEKKSESKSRSRSSKEPTPRGRSRTLGSLELKDDLEKALLLAGQGDTKGERSRTKISKSNLKKCNSEEFIDKVVEREKVAGGSRSRGHESSSKLKRAKSGSAIDYKHVMEFKVFSDIPIDDSPKHKRKNSLSKSRSKVDHTEAKSAKDRDQNRNRSRSRSRSQPRHHHGDTMSPVQSPVSAPESPSSPLLSKDSGVSGLNMKGTDVTLMDRLLNSDTIRHQERLSKVISLLQDEFAYDGYMENGIEDLAMGTTCYTLFTYI